MRDKKGKLWCGIPITRYPGTVPVRKEIVADGNIKG